MEQSERVTVFDGRVFRDDGVLAEVELENGRPAIELVEDEDGVAENARDLRRRIAFPLSEEYVILDVG